MTEDANLPLSFDGLKLRLEEGWLKDAVGASWCWCETGSGSYFIVLPIDYSLPSPKPPLERLLDEVDVWMVDA
jgi:hypothetical protein